MTTKTKLSEKYTLIAAEENAIRAKSASIKKRFQKYAIICIITTVLGVIITLKMGEATLFFICVASFICTAIAARIIAYYLYKKYPHINQNISVANWITNEEWRAAIEEIVSRNIAVISKYIADCVQITEIQVREYIKSTEVTFSKHVTGNYGEVPTISYKIPAITTSVSIDLIDKDDVDHIIIHIRHENDVIGRGTYEKEISIT